MESRRPLRVSGFGASAGGEDSDLLKEFRTNCFIEGKGDFSARLGIREVEDEETIFAPADVVFNTEVGFVISVWMSCFNKTCFRYASSGV